MYDLNYCIATGSLRPITIPAGSTIRVFWRPDDAAAQWGLPDAEWQAATIREDGYTERFGVLRTTLTLHRKCVGVGLGYGPARYLNPETLYGPMVERVATRYHLTRAGAAESIGTTTDALGYYPATDSTAESFVADLPSDEEPTAADILAAWHAQGAVEHGPLSPLGAAMALTSEPRDGGAW